MGENGKLSLILKPKNTSIHKLNPFSF